MERTSGNGFTEHIRAGLRPAGRCNAISHIACRLKYGCMSQRHPVRSSVIMLVTINTLNREPIFRDPVCAREAIEELYRVQGLFPFFLFGFVIMPDHCHFLVNVPCPGTISRVMHCYKKGLSFQLLRGPIWQPRFHVMSPSKPWEALHYVHFNPVRAHIVETPEAYPWSSACGRWDVTRLDDVGG